MAYEQKGKYTPHLHKMGQEIREDPIKQDCKHDVDKSVQVKTGLAYKQKGECTLRHKKSPQVGDVVREETVAGEIHEDIIKQGRGNDKSVSLEEYQAQLGELNREHREDACEIIRIMTSREKLEQDIVERQARIDEITEFIEGKRTESMLKNGKSGEQEELEYQLGLLL